jgi:hypothetical protein
VTWLAVQAGLHLVFGTSLFLYSGHWVFAVVAVAALGLEVEASASIARGRAVQAMAITLVVLQAAANASLVADIVRLYSRR